MLGVSDEAWEALERENDSLQRENARLHVALANAELQLKQARSLRDETETDMESARELLRLHEKRWRPIVDAAAKWDEAWLLGNANVYVHTDLHNVIHRAATS